MWLIGMPFNDVERWATILDWLSQPQEVITSCKTDFGAKVWLSEGSPENWVNGQCFAHQQIVIISFDTDVAISHLVGRVECFDKDFLTGSYKSFILRGGW